MRPSKPVLGTFLATTAMALALAACDRNSAQQPLSNADLALPATAALTSPGPLVDRYGPPPKKVAVGRVVNARDDWAWADRSYALDSVFYDTPPDYGFYYDDYEPWVWQTSDRWAMYGDPYDYGYPYDDDYYYYYYQPGAVRPYFIRDDEYGYGFDDVGRLVVIYDLLGRIMPQSFLYEREPYASRYYQRAYLVRQASLRAQPVVVTETVWLQQAPVIQRYQQRWIEAAQTQPQWVDYRQRTGDRFVRSFADDRRQRAQRLQVAMGASQQTDRGFLASPMGARDRTAPHTPVAQNDRRGFFGLGGDGRNRQRGQIAPVQQRRTAQAEQPKLGGLFGGGRNRQREEAALQRQDRADQNRRGFLNARGRGAERQEGLQDQPRGRDRQAFARRQQGQQHQLQAQAQAENGRQRQSMMRQQREAKAKARQEQGHPRQEAARQQRGAQAEARQQQQAQARQEQGRQRQEIMRQQRQAQAEARQLQQAQARQEQGRQRQEAARQQHAAEAQARQQQQAQARQAEAQARRQQQAQAREAERQARQAQQAQARQQQVQAQRQQQAQQQQAQAQAHQQQAQQAQAQRHQQAQQKKKNDEAQAAQQNGHGHGKKG